MTSVGVILFDPKAVKRGPRAPACATGKLNQVSRKSARCAAAAGSDTSAVAIQTDFDGRRPPGNGPRARERTINSSPDPRFSNSRAALGRNLQRVTMEGPAGWQPVRAEPALSVCCRKRLPVSSLTSTASATTASDSVLPAGRKPLVSARDLSTNDDFLYTPVPVFVPLSLGTAAVSLVAFLWELLTVIPLLGAAFGAIAMLQISRARGGLGGWWLAVTGTVLCTVMLVASGGLHAYTIMTEVPAGYQRINFASDISAKEFVAVDGKVSPPAEVLALSQQQVFLKGYMYPTRQSTNLPRFILCKDSGDCCFGGQPKQTDMMLIEMQDGATVNFATGLVAVAGEFLAEPSLDPTGLQPVYKLKCKYFSPAKSSF